MRRFLKHQPKLHPDECYYVTSYARGYNGKVKGFNFKNSLCNKGNPLSYDQVNLLRSAGFMISWFKWELGINLEHNGINHIAYIFEPKQEKPAPSEPKKTKKRRRGRPKGSKNKKQI